MKNIIKIKYLCAVVIIMIATAFSSCASDEEVYELEAFSAQEDKHDSKYTMGDFDENDADADSVLAIKEGQNQRDVDEETTIYVYVCGAVKTPGVYELKSGMRVVDCVNVAGGLLDEAAKEYLNLASTLKDGEKVYVPTYSEIEEILAEGYEYSNNSVTITSKENLIQEKGDDGKDSDGKSQNGLININTANAQELMTIPGVGESKASKIIEYREKNGGFSTIEDIMLISGIKEGMFNKIKDYICVD